MGFKTPDGKQIFGGNRTPRFAITSDGNLRMRGSRASGGGLRVIGYVGDYDSELQGECLEFFRRWHSRYTTVEQAREEFTQYWEEKEDGN